MIRAAKRTLSQAYQLKSSFKRSLSTAIENGDKEITLALPEEAFELYHLDNGPDLDFKLTKQQLLDMYREMVVIRRMEMAADALYKAKEIRGFCHLSTGQEAIAVGIESAINKEDTVITSYRCHGFAYMRGASVASIIGELLGKANGCSKGKGGSMHIYTPNFFGGNGIVGAQVPLGLGLGFAHKYRNEKSACFTLYGDGAANQGQVFEAYNMAKLWDVPVVFACENNKYGMGTAASRASALTDYYKRGQYIPGLKINGMDVLSCYMGSVFAKNWCISGKGPLVLEYETYRYGGHSMSDPGTTYRTRDEIKQMRSHHDPINGLKARLLDLEVATEQEIKSVDKEARAFVESEIDVAHKAEFPKATPEVLFEDVYLKGNEIPMLRGRIPSENFYFK
ncbi:Pyruvate dehydrogenase E1 component subunit alpha, mitochondrial [Wickerhamiella sorbophila]|uniref:Pyruvate dehydrogenase E1 component subunit alpha n=1 Tax=Wickerhamiella sorbophila TaxID=45607 RepID=A0A2T0FI64_9ASCO|nr:Pyruvate dehydrogenase E1 component subunit alpha, mitochondrial [Wickerhamiella sorbophila]PRT54680.1 Pyruvate dehydrogenase E1 component subunit alpha, mitochondrial [Wickerhamiella sorbophila]